MIPFSCKLYDPGSLLIKLAQCPNSALSTLKKEASEKQVSTYINTYIIYGGTYLVVAAELLHRDFYLHQVQRDFHVDRRAWDETTSVFTLRNVKHCVALIVRNLGFVVVLRSFTTVVSTFAQIK